MVHDTINSFSNAAVKKVQFLQSSAGRYLALSILAGIYVGLGIILIFSLGDPLAKVAAPALKALMGASFAVALILVIFAGSELFTGNNMVMTIGVATKIITPMQGLQLWGLCYLGNLMGALFLALLIAGAGMFATTGEVVPLIVQTSLAKASAPFEVLLIKGFLCNLLVCLAVWTASRTTDDTARLVLIFWCLFAFIGSGYEHSVANMTVLGVGALVSEQVTWVHFMKNMIPVTIGNILSGVALGLVYWYIASKELVTSQKERVHHA